MKFHLPKHVLAVLWLSGIDGFHIASPTFTRQSSPTSLQVSIGLGPDDNKTKEKDPVAGVDYEVPDHEPITKDTVLKLAFDVAEGAEKGNTNFSINSLARFVNMHVQYRFIPV